MTEQTQKREEPGTAERAAELARFVERHAADMGYTMTEQLTAYNLLMVDTLLRIGITELGIEVVAMTFANSLRDAYNESERS